MKKIILILGMILFLTGCGTDGEYVSKEPFDIYIDEETCIEYFISDTRNNAGTVTPRYNQDGTLKINEDCLGGVNKNDKFQRRNL